MPGRDHDDVALLSAAAREAGAVLLQWLEVGAKIWDKRGTPVTEADHASNTLLHERLTTARPDYGWLSEESQDDDRRLSATRVFVVDPLDGTVSFIKRKDDFTISLGIVDQGEPVVGVVYNPSRDEMFTGIRGVGAWLNGTPIQASPRPDQIENCRMVASRSMFQHPFWPVPWPAMDFMKIGSIAYRLALVAAGKADATVALKGKCDWDIAAGEVIAREAGVVVTAHDGTPFRYNRRSTDQISLLAAPEPLYGALSARLSGIKLPSQSTA